MSTRTVRICDLCHGEKTREIVHEVMPGVDACTPCLLDKKAGDLSNAIAIAKRQQAKERGLGAMDLGKAGAQLRRAHGSLGVPGCGHSAYQVGCAECARWTVSG